MLVQKTLNYFLLGMWKFWHHEQGIFLVHYVHKQVRLFPILYYELFWIPKDLNGFAPTNSSGWVPVRMLALHHILNALEKNTRHFSFWSCIWFLGFGSCLHLVSAPPCYQVFIFTSSLAPRQYRDAKPFSKNKVHTLLEQWAKDHCINLHNNDHQPIEEGKTNSKYYHFQGWLIILHKIAGTYGGLCIAEYSVEDLSLKGMM